MSDQEFPKYIAEIGVNHAGSLDIALDHISMAANIGFDFVKFQYIDSKKIWHSSCHQKDKLSTKEEFQYEWFEPIKKLCKSLEIKVGYTPTFQGASAIIKNADSDFIKIASPQSEFDKFILDEAIETGLDLVVSNGYSDLDSTLNLIRYLAQKDLKATMLFCVSEYPADNILFPLNEALEVFKACKDLGLKYGFSDHYKSILPALNLAQSGATLFEKHFILDNVDSLDKIVSSNIFEAREYIKQINIASKKPKGLRTNTIIDKEFKFSSSFYMSRNVKKGETVNLKDFTRLRNCDGQKNNTNDLWKLFKNHNLIYAKDLKVGDRLKDGDFKY